MIWKMIIKLLGCRSKDYITAITLGKEVYVVDIHKHIPEKDELRKWENALEKTKA